MVGCTSSEHAKKISIGVKKYWEENPITEEWRIKNSIAHQGTIFTEAHKEKLGLSIKESSVGGFWYGNVRYKNYTKKYCCLWNEDLKERIRAYWGYVSALSGKEETSVRSNGLIQNIACHHVYYQKKACCVWDEDEKGYYANINIGTNRNKKTIKYYIDGDPNKFVTLTAKEHIKTDCNKIYWIKTFEKLIADQGGKCYFTKTDIENLLK